MNESANNILRAYLVDDELLALKRLAKLLAANKSLEIIGSATDPATALSFLQTQKVDVLFLDIEMPGMNGFELLAQLKNQPIVIFTTAYNEYALKAFEVNSIDYLLKPIAPLQLERAINKINNLRNSTNSVVSQDQFQKLFLRFANQINSPQVDLPIRVNTRVGDRILLIELDKIAYFQSEDKLTFAATADNKKYIVESTISQLEEKFSQNGFARVHRATLVNLKFINELHRWFGGRILIQLNDKNKSKITVSRERVGILKQKLGLA